MATVKGADIKVGMTLKGGTVQNPVPRTVEYVKPAGDRHVEVGGSSFGWLVLKTERIELFDLSENQ